MSVVGLLVFVMQFVSIDHLHRSIRP